MRTTVQEVLSRLSGLGVRLRTESGRLLASPAERVTPDVLHTLRAHKPELLQALATEPLPDPRSETRRQRVLIMLDAHPTARYALVTDEGADPGAVLLTLAIRGQATCELRIPRDKYDGTLLLDLIEQHGGTVQ